MLVAVTRSTPESFCATKSATSFIEAPSTSTRRSCAPLTRCTARISGNRAIRSATSSNPRPRSGATVTSTNAVTRSSP